MSDVEITRIDNFVCPACGEVIRQVAARDGVVKGWCPQAKKEIKVSVNEVVAEVKEEIKKAPRTPVPLSHLDTLQLQREKVLKDVVSAREDGDLKENSAYHAARETLSIIDGKILQETEKLKRQNREE
jgi:transcription initiation factor IIE alpha subunit